MKTASKLLSMLLLVAMCLSLMGGSAYATGDLMGSFGGSDSQLGGSNALGGSLNAGQDTSGLAVTPAGGDDSQTSTDGNLLSGTPSEERETTVQGSGISLYTGSSDPAAGKVQNAANPEDTYVTVKKALEAGVTNLVFTGDVTETENLTLGNCTINLNGYAWLCDSVLSVSGNATVKNGGIVTEDTVNINGSLTFNNAILVRYGIAFSGGTVNIYGTDPSIFWSQPSIFTKSSSTINIYSGYFEKVDGMLTAIESRVVTSTSTIDQTSNDNFFIVRTGKNPITLGSNGQKYSTFAAALAAAATRDTLTIEQDINAVAPGDLVVDGKNITVRMSNQVVTSNATVKNGGSLTLGNGELDGSITVNGGTLTLDGSSFFAGKDVTLNASGSTIVASGNTTLNSLTTLASNAVVSISGGTYQKFVVSGGTTGTQLNISGGKFYGVEINGNVNGNITGGLFNVDVKPYVAAGYTTVANDGMFEVRRMTGSASVSQLTSGNYVASLNAADGTNPTTFGYRVDPGRGSLTGISLLDHNGVLLKNLASGDDFYKQNTNEYYILSASILGLKKADRIIVRFEFTDGADTSSSIYVLPEFAVANTPWYEGSKNYTKFTMTNAAPAGYRCTYSNGNTFKNLLVEGTDYTTSNGGATITLTESFLKSLPTGNYNLLFMYDTGLYRAMAFAVNTNANPNPNPNPTPVPPGDVAIWPVDSNEWYSGDGMLAFYYRPAIDFSDPAKKGLWIDGWLQDPTNWITNSNSGLLKIGTAILNNLSRGWHTVSINTVDGVASCQFYVGATLRPVDTDKHVTGSSKNLQFVCSDPISRVWIGGTELTNLNYGDYWTLSSSRKTITLTAKFMNSQLVAGKTYDLYVQTDNGDRPSCSFQILTTAQASSSPRTGDESNLALWASVLVLAGGAAVAILPRLKKNEN